MRVDPAKFCRHPARPNPSGSDRRRRDGRQVSRRTRR